MTELLTSIGIWAVVLTLGLYQLGLWVQKKTGLALCNPILIAAAAVILLLRRFMKSDGLITRMLPGSTSAIVMRRWNCCLTVVHSVLLKGM